VLSASSGQWVIMVILSNQGAFPSPGAICHRVRSKWNKSEHRLFSFITGNWRGKPLIGHQIIAELSAATTTKTGLKVRCQTTVRYLGIEVDDALAIAEQVDV
jgi:hypothetical protein